MKRILLLVLLCASPGLAGPASRPTVAVNPSGCVTADCHANIKSSKVVHGPVANNTCDACHEVLDVEAHTFSVTRQGADLCTYCHEFDVSAAPVVHKPVREGQCLGCHDPHGGADRMLGREASIQALCNRCHESVTLDHKFVHTPVKKGQCDSCHPPHAAMFPKLLDAADTDLCLACHSEFDASLAKARFRHKALEKGCLKCHGPHGGPEPMQVKTPPVELCQSCHEKVRDEIAQATYKHSAATKDRACMTCHTAHGGDNVKLMIEQPVKLCMTCHKDEIKIGKKRVIPAVAELNDSAMHKHGAIKDGQCSGCHAAHGSKQPLLLTKVYSRVLYQPFEASNYELCFSCHDVRLAQSESADGITGFRNGTRNLHSVHVKEGQRGRSCFMCHTTHASANARNVRATTPYKVWNMPIRFSKTETGGSCAPGCHVPWAYDRETPVSRPTSRPSRDAAPIVRADPQGPVMVEMAADDTSGRKVSAPDPRRATVLLLLGAMQSSDERIITAVSQAVSAPRDVQVIVILCGSEAAARPLPWPVVLDADCTIASQLDVHGWPTALVLRPDGLQVARIGGAPESLVLKLGPYLDLASGAAGQADLEQRLATNGVVSDGPTRRASRDRQLAEKLLSEAKPADALKLLNESLKIEPDSLPLSVLRIRALLAMNKGTDVIAALSKIQPDALPPGQHDVLRARAMIAMKRRADAKQILLETVARVPDLAEAHYVLGTLYEQDGDWQNAAKEYRAASPASAPASAPK